MYFSCANRKGTVKCSTLKLGRGGKTAVSYLNQYALDWWCCGKPALSAGRSFTASVKGRNQEQRASRKKLGKSVWGVFWV